MSYVTSSAWRDFPLVLASTVPRIIYMRQRKKDTISSLLAARDRNPLASLAELASETGLSRAYIAVLCRELGISTAFPALRRETIERDTATAALPLGPVVHTITAPVRQMIYALCDNREPGRVRYIGSTTHVLSRVASHMSRTVTNHVGNWIDTVLKQGGCVTVHEIVVTASDRLDLYRAEWGQIAAHTRRGEADLNQQSPDK